MNETLIIVPTYNERENLVPLTERVLALPVPLDLLIVDDNSPDGTGKIARQLRQQILQGVWASGGNADGDHTRGGAA